MRAISATPRGSVFRALLVGAFFDRRRILAVGGGILLAALATALLVRPLYEARSTLLVLLGTEYTYRPVAGEQASVAGALDREQILRTEAEILGDEDLHRAVIRSVGLQRLYPGAGGSGGPIAALRRLLSGGRGAPPDPVEAVLPAFDAHLDIAPERAGNAIELGFAHPDPLLAAEVLNTLEQGFLRRRRELYDTAESGIIEHRVQDLRAQLDAASSSLTRFELDHGIGDIQARRAILLQQQGALETDLKAADSQAAQEAARQAQLDRQLQRVPRDVVEAQETDLDARVSPTRLSIDALRARETELQAHYQDGSPLLADVRRQMRAREADLARGHADGAPGTTRTGSNPLFLSVQTDRARSEVEMQAARARQTQDMAGLVDVRAELLALTRDEQQIVDLQRARAVLDDDYRTAVKLRDDRRMTEDVEASRQANVRVLQPALPPVRPRPTRRLILAAGVVLAALGAAATALVSHAFRRVYLLPEALEVDTGLMVLGCIPELPGLAAPDFVLRPE